MKRYKHNVTKLNLGTFYIYTYVCQGHTYVYM